MLSLQQFREPVHHRFQLLEVVVIAQLDPYPIVSPEKAVETHANAINGPRDPMTEKNNLAPRQQGHCQYSRPDAGVQNEEPIGDDGSCVLISDLVEFHLKWVKDQKREEPGIDKNKEKDCHRGSYLKGRVNDQLSSALRGFAHDFSFFTMEFLPKCERLMLSDYRIQKTEYRRAGVPRTKAKLRKAAAVQ